VYVSVFAEPLKKKPQVNQGAAVLLTSRARARALGIAERRLVSILGGAAASEPDDILDRPSFADVPAQNVVLGAVRTLAGDRLGDVELYSCFPCVPKLARRTLGLGAETAISVAGGLTFFGGPLNGYMLHAAIAMVQRLRAGGGKPALLYGQGGYLTKHHALLLGTESAERLERGTAPPQAARAAPRLTQEHRGRATLETFTVLYARDGAPLHGIALCRTDGGQRVLARVPANDSDTLAVLTARDKSPIGSAGAVVSRGESSHPEWHLA